MGFKTCQVSFLYMRPSVFISFLFFLILNSSFSKTPFTDNIFISPGITIGYTFGAGINYGYSLDVGLINSLLDHTNVRYGLSYYKYFVKVKKYTHRLRSFG